MHDSKQSAAFRELIDGVRSAWGGAAPRFRWTGAFFQRCAALLAALGRAYAIKVGYGAGCRSSNSRPARHWHAMTLAVTGCEPCRHPPWKCALRVMLYRNTSSTEP